MLLVSCNRGVRRHRDIVGATTHVLICVHTEAPYPWLLPRMPLVSCSRGKRRHRGIARDLQQPTHSCAHTEATCHWLIPRHAPCQLQPWYLMPPRYCKRPPPAHTLMRTHTRCQSTPGPLAGMPFSQLPPWQQMWIWHIHIDTPAVNTHSIPAHTCTQSWHTLSCGRDRVSHKNQPPTATNIHTHAERETVSRRGTRVKK